MIFTGCIAAENEVADNRPAVGADCLIRNSETENAAACRLFSPSASAGCPVSEIVLFIVTAARLYVNLWGTVADGSVISAAAAETVPWPATGKGRRAAAVNGQDERFAPLTRRRPPCFFETRRADTDCACPPVHTYSGAWEVLIFQSELQFGAPVSGRIRRCSFADRLSYDGGAGEFCVQQDFGKAPFNRIPCGTE